MNTEKWFKETLKSIEENFEFRFETLILEITEEICKIMEEKGISRSRLARTLNVTPAAVTKILNGNSNFRLRTLLALSDALDADLRIRILDRNEYNVEGIFTSANQGTFVDLAVVGVPSLKSWMVGYNRTDLYKEEPVSYIADSDDTCTHHVTFLPDPHVIKHKDSTKRIRQV